MVTTSVLDKLRRGLIVSCQALENEPLHGSDMMARMALAVEEGGAVGIRANSGKDIQAIKEVIALPVIGIVKRRMACGSMNLSESSKKNFPRYWSWGDPDRQVQTGCPGTYRHSYGQ